MKITFENGLSQPVSSGEELEEALTTLKAPDNTFFILEQPSGAYMQAALVDGAWWVEKREEDTDHQMRAFGGERSGLFSISELNEIASCYLKGTDCAAVVVWRKSESVAQSKDLGFDKPLEPWRAQASLTEKLRWFEAWRDYFLLRFLFIGLVAVGVGFVVVLAAIIWRDLFG